MGVLSSECLGDETIARFVDGALEPEEDVRARSHIDSCETCRQLLADVGLGADSNLAVTEPREGAGDGKLLSGQMIDGKYRIVRTIGEGGMGTVYAALHVELAQMVAIKVLKKEAAADSDLVQRFLREGRAAAALRGDHAVRINDVGRTRAGVPYIVMELLEGEDLESLMNTRPLGIGEAVDYVLQACVALTEAHANGLVHRDIKPQNLFLAKMHKGPARIKVLDFGLAKEIGQVKIGGDLTQENVLLGSPQFMSPEQIRNPSKVDLRTDVWSLGATLFKLIAGKPPFTSYTVHGLLGRILTDPVPPLRDARPEVPPEVERVVERCLAKSVDARYVSVEALATELRSAILPISIAAKRAGVEPVLPETTPRASDPKQSSGTSATMKAASGEVAAVAAPTLVSKRMPDDVVTIAQSAPPVAVLDSAPPAPAVAAPARALRLDVPAETVRNGAAPPAVAPAATPPSLRGPALIGAAIGLAAVLGLVAYQAAQRPAGAASSASPVRATESAATGEPSAKPEPTSDEPNANANANANATATATATANTTATPGAHPPKARLVPTKPSAAVSAPRPPTSRDPYSWDPSQR